MLTEPTVEELKAMRLDALAAAWLEHHQKPDLTSLSFERAVCHARRRGVAISGEPANASRSQRGQAADQPSPWATRAPGRAGAGPRRSCRGAERGRPARHRRGRWAPIEQAHEGLRVSTISKCSPGQGATTRLTRSTMRSKPAPAAIAPRPSAVGRAATAATERLHGQRRERLRSKPANCDLED